MGHRQKKDSDDETYCLVTAGQATTYSGVVEVTLQEKVLRVVLGPRAREELGFDDPEGESGGGGQGDPDTFRISRPVGGRIAGSLNVLSGRDPGRRGG
ncbi:MULTISPECIES: hypothetical protein [unclassified Streptosporangium]|uniref:hypothetical protein n=1 Tax=unclassified Streptosporangium TaxID=2632669 RepID=UPI002E2AE070|nr:MULTISPECIES: hypothetical protein [unclassified Streptosporangium]